MSHIEKRIAKEQERLLEQFRRMPIVHIACEKTGISRATYYRWRNEDPNFADEADSALQEGVSLINDMAESQLIAAIRDRNITAIAHWLSHHHPAYKNRLEVTGNLQHSYKLTPEEETLVSKALSMVSQGGNNHD